MKLLSYWRIIEHTTDDGRFRLCGYLEFKNVKTILSILSINKNIKLSFDPSLLKHPTNVIRIIEGGDKRKRIKRILVII